MDDEVDGRNLNSCSFDETAQYSPVTSETEIVSALAQESAKVVDEQQLLDSLYKREMEISASDGTKSQYLVSTSHSIICIIFRTMQNLVEAYFRNPPKCYKCRSEESVMFFPQC